MTPQLMQSIQLLQMTHVELTQFIAQEVEKNPLLEIPSSDGDGDAGERGEAADEPYSQQTEDAGDGDYEARGETLSGIARKYGVSTGSLRSVNSSKIQAGGGIHVGQVLLIPNS